MTQRLVQETLLDQVFKSHLIQKAKQKKGMEDDDLLQLRSIANKLDFKNLNQAVQSDQGNDPRDYTGRTNNQLSNLPE